MNKKQRTPPLSFKQEPFHLPLTALELSKPLVARPLLPSSIYDRSYSFMSEISLNRLKLGLFLPVFGRVEVSGLTQSYH